MILKLILFLITVSFTLTSYAGRFFIPPIEKSLVHYSLKRPSSELGENFSILVWNVHKGKDEQAWVNDMNGLAQSTDIFFLQEAMDDDLMENLFGKQLGNYEWFFAKSFSYSKSDFSSGVATGAVVKASSTSIYRTTDTEPIVGTPKSNLISYYKLSDGQTLAVLNIHGLNRTANKAFYKQIDDTLKLVKDHQGPIIYAGDFNTNNKEKTARLIEMMEAVGLKLVTYDFDDRKNHLDWIFYRGCRVIESELLYNYQSSDHIPLTAKFNCN